MYAHLREIAQRQMMGERAGHTLSATALVHETFMKMAASGPAPADKAAFYHAAAQAMRRILVDHARRRGAVKRGGGARREVMEIESVLDLAREEHVEDILALDAALLRLEEEDAEAGGIVRLRFFVGLTGDQAAEALGISARQADRAWAYARAFLLREIRASDHG